MKPASHSVRPIPAYPQPPTPTPPAFTMNNPHGTTAVSYAMLPSVQHRHAHSRPNHCLCSSHCMACCTAQCIHCSGCVPLSYPYPSSLPHHMLPPRQFHMSPLVEHHSALIGALYVFAQVIVRLAAQHSADIAVAMFLCALFARHSALYRSQHCGHRLALGLHRSQHKPKVLCSMGEFMHTCMQQLHLLTAQTMRGFRCQCTKGLLLSLASVSWRRLWESSV